MVDLLGSTDATRRARALERLHHTEVLPSASLQRVVRLAVHLAGGDGVAAAVHLLDDRFQHRIAAAEAPCERSPVGESMCLVSVQEDRVVWSPDPPSDTRFTGNRWTSGPTPLRMYFAAPLRLGDGVPVGSLCVWHTESRPLDDETRDRLTDLADTTSAHLELLALTRELGHDAAHDTLTGLANRVVLAQRLTASLAHMDDVTGPALVLVDLDGFKGVNDEHGHAVGDEVLVSTAARLRAAVRPDDLVSRIGGDEFAVLFDGVHDDEGLAELCRRLREATAEPHLTSVGPVTCGFSTGVARARRGDLPYELLGRADVDLYSAKQPIRTARKDH